MNHRCRNRAWLGAALMVLCFVAGPGRADEDPYHFRSDIARIELTVPSGWHFMDLESVARHRATAELKDEEMQKAIQQLATAPLVVATKHPEPYDALNPSFQVMVRPLGSLATATGVEILELIRPNLASTFAEFKLLEAPTEFKLGGLSAARLTATYTVQNPAGETFPTKAIVFVVPRGSYMYQFSFSAPPDGEDALTPEVVQKVYDSVRFLE